MRRRTLLAGLGAAAATACATAVAPSPSPSATPRATGPTSTPAATRSPTPSPTPTPRPAPDWAALRAQLHGTLYLPTTGLDDVRLLYNTRFDGIRPTALVRCADPVDVQRCVSFAADSAVPIAIRSGGHSYGGWSTGTGLVIDVGAMDAVTVSNGAVTVGAGAKLIDVYDAVASRGAGIAAGSCPTVGIAGLTLGGGLGVLTRAWGLTCDQLTNIDIVTADGVLRHCSANEEPDLFWALRGGGNGSFGVVTALRFATHPVGSLAVAFLTWEVDAGAVLRAWQAWMSSAPETLWSTLHLEALEGGGSSLSVHAVYAASAQAMAAEVDRLVAAAGRPTYRESGVRSYRDVMLLEAGCLGLSVPACHLRSAGGQLGRETYAAKSIVAPSTLSDEAIGALVQNVAFARIGGASVLIDALGGAVRAIPTDATAFPHRSAFAVMQLIASWAEGATGEAAMSWLRGAYAGARRTIGTGAYANYADPELEDWPAAYYGANYPRLQQIKQRYDPGRVFNFPQAIVPA